jgi:DNA-binding NarL/FixJ family response regulator
MPLLDGHAAFRELVQIRPDVRVVLMSGFSQQQAIHRFGTVRPSGFLQKPFGREALRRVLAEVPDLHTTSLR